MKYAVLVLALAFAAAGCKAGSSSTSAPTPTSGVQTVTFTADLKPSNEAPNPVINAESTASGTANISFSLTRDAANNITNAVGNATVTMTGFPAGASITLAHIHTGAAGVAGPVLINFIPSGTVTLTNGAGSFSQQSPISVDQATNILNNPAGFYFNVHTALNPGGVMRGQLVKQ